MSDLISRSEVLNRLSYYISHCMEHSQYAYKVAYREVETAPAVDAEPVVHGHIVWKDRRRGGVRKVTGRDEFGVEHTVRYMESYVERTPYCSVCTKVLGDALTYCPNCGAKMDEKEE